MYRILHTADWHIGKTLAAYDRTAEFEIFFERLLDSIASEKPNLMIVAGDVFDTATPSNAVAGIYYKIIDTLHLRFPDLKVIITSGNHDSPSYLNAPKEILHYFNVEVIGSVIRDDNGVCFRRMIFDFDDIIICAVPYLRRGDIVAMGGDNPSVAEFYRRILDEAVELRGSRDIPIVATGHLTTIGATYNKNADKTITATIDDSIGGLDNIAPADFPAEFSYIALGHIHRRQKAGDRENIWYSGSPLPFSFAEKDYRHSLSIVDFDGANLSQIRTIDLPNVVNLRYVPEQLADFDTVSNALRRLPDDEEMYIEINLRPEYRSPEIKARIINELLKDKRAKFCGFRIVDLSGPDAVNGSSNDDSALSFEPLQTIDPMTMISDIYRSRMRAELSDRHAQMLRSIIDEINQQ